MKTPRPRHSGKTAAVFALVGFVAALVSAADLFEPRAHMVLLLDDEAELNEDDSRPLMRLPPPLPLLLTPLEQQWK